MKELANVYLLMKNAKNFIEIHDIVMNKFLVPYEILDYGSKCMHGY